MPRVKVRKEVEEGLKYDSEDFRFATPKIVADYRAKRLKCDTLLEIGAGVGFQTVAFAKKCKKVYAVEIDERKVGYLNKNVAKLKNVEVIHGDGLSDEVAKIKADAVFVDTERAASEDIRKLSSIKPDIKKLVELYKDVCIELPPQIRGIELDCEKEYVSVDGELNRLNLYFGKLKTYKTNVVSLPEEKRLVYKGRTLKETKSFDHKFVYEIDAAVVRAGLVGELPKGEIFKFENKAYLVSNRKLKSDFLTEYKVLKVCNVPEIKKALKELKCGEVVIKFKVEPEEYWKVRKKYEMDLKGKKQCYLFVFGKAVICGKTKDK